MKSSLSMKELMLFNIQIEKALTFVNTENCGGSADFSIPSPEWRAAGATVPCWRAFSTHSRSVALLIPP